MRSSIGEMEESFWIWGPDGARVNSLSGRWLDGRLINFWREIVTKIRHDVMLRLVKVLDVVMITLPFAACWVWYYAAKTPLDGTWQGHAVILGLYAVLFILLGKTYDAFWMSMQRVSELMYGQVLAAMATDGIFYIVICLMATKLCNLLPGIAAIAGQFVMAGIWSAVAHRWYYRHSLRSLPPWSMMCAVVWKS